MKLTRFAPSPTGLLHLGHAYAAGVAARLAAGLEDKFLVRLEDIDATRCRPVFAAAILADLRWLGLRFPEPVLAQSSRMGAYAAALSRLTALGLVYPCFCSRRDIAAAADAMGPEGALYSGTCRSLPAGACAARMAAEPYALRLDVAKAVAMAGPLTFTEEGGGPHGETGVIAADPGLFGDVVLARKETPTAYHLAVVVDDAFQGVNLVSRGVDLFAACHIQRLLQALLGLPEPHYHHHRLILDEQGHKFAKRNHSVTLAALRDAGVTPAEIWQRVGLSPEL
ncbi:MAG: tRNA glutamyl-Q(34) synthetase GluQRS [Rhizomicrobium sp.]